VHFGAQSEQRVDSEKQQSVLQKDAWSFGGGLLLLFAFVREESDRVPGE
jgi:hypothetical protein